MTKFDLPLERRVLGPILSERARTEGSRVYLRHEDRTFSFAETDAFARELARGLASAGIGRKDSVALLLPNCPEFVFSWFALSLLGAVMVPINTSYKQAMLDYVIRDSGVKGLITDRALLPALAGASAEILAQLEWVAVLGGTDAAELPQGTARFIDFDALRQRGEANAEVECDCADVNCVMYTSGTTGASKGAVLSNGAFFGGSLPVIGIVGLERDDVLFTPLPLFHGIAGRQGVYPCLLVGAQVVLGERFSATRFWQQATQSQATVAHTMFNIPAMLKAQPPGQYDRAHRLRYMYNASHDPEFEQRFGVRLAESYGLIETGTVIYTPHPGRKLGSCGRLHDDWEAQLVDERDQPVAAGEAGELILRPRLSGILMQGYLNKPEETLNAIRDGWFHTGDFAHRDGDGWYFFAGRKKERIRRRGENISAWEVEKIAQGHPDVEVCAALPYPSELGDDDVRLAIVLRAGSQLSEERFMDWLQPRMPYFMLPRYVEFLPELPLTPTKKVRKHVLIERGLCPNAWDREQRGYKIERTERAAAAPRETS